MNDTYWGEHLAGISGGRRFAVGDRVVKDPAGWIPTDFDAWGAGEGIGVVVEVDPALYLADVRWPAGQAWQAFAELLPVPPATPEEE